MPGTIPAPGTAQHVEAHVARGLHVRKAAHRMGPRKEAEHNASHIA
jgi:hypothetical protein